MLIVHLLLLAIGFFLLVKGADWFVDGASGVARKFRIPELIIGLTVVAMGTSVPELSVSLTDAFKGEGAITVGNVLGSNICNILLILGLSALFSKLPIQKSSYKTELPFLVAVSALLVLLGAWGNTLHWWNGLIFVILMVAFITYTVIVALKNPSAENEEEEEEEMHKTGFSLWVENKIAPVKDKIWYLLLQIAIGICLVVFGSDITVDAASSIASALNMSDSVIGLTVVAIGTSLPELVTSVIAAKKGKTDIAVGNIIGSNIFNILVVLGISVLICPVPFGIEFIISGLISLFITVLLWIFSLFKKHELSKLHGAIFLSLFILYYVYLFLNEYGVINFS